SLAFRARSRKMADAAAVRRGPPVALTRARYDGTVRRLLPPPGAFRHRRGTVAARHPARLVAGRARVDGARLRLPRAARSRRHLERARHAAHRAAGDRFLALRSPDLLRSYRPAQAPRQQGLAQERLESRLRAALEPLTWHSSRSLPPRKCSPTACGRSSQSRLPCERASSRRFSARRAAARRRCSEWWPGCSRRPADAFAWVTPAVRNAWRSSFNSRR